LLNQCIHSRPTRSACPTISECLAGAGVKGPKATRGRAALPKLRETGKSVSLISHAVLLECDASSHRFHLLNINALKRMYAIFAYRFYQNWELSPQAASMDENHLQRQLWIAQS